MTAPEVPGADTETIPARHARPRDGWEHPDHLEGVHVTTWYSELDGVPVVQVDVDSDTGPVRVRLHDGPDLYDGNPEVDQPPAHRARTALDGAQGLIDNLWRVAPDLSGPARDILDDLSDLIAAARGTSTTSKERHP